MWLSKGVAGPDPEADYDIGLKVTDYTSLATCVTVIRKYRNASMEEIVSAINGNEYVLCFDYDDDEGLWKIIACYKALGKANIGAQLYEMDNEPSPEHQRATRETEHFANVGACLSPNVGVFGN